MYCCIPKGTRLWWKKGTVINHGWCNDSFLLGPTFCHHNFNSFPASSSFPLYSIFTWKLIFLFIPPPFYGPCIPKLLSFLSGLCFFHPLPQQSSPAALLPYFRHTGERSLILFSPSSSLCPQLPITALILPAPQIHASSPRIFWKVEREKCLWEECEKWSLSVSLWELPGEMSGC